MPTIPIYERQQSYQPGTISPAAGQAAGARIGEAGEQLGAVAAEQARRAAEQQERAEALETSRVLAQSRLDWTRTLIERQQGAAEGAPGFTDSLAADFAEYRQRTLEGLPENARPYAETRLIELQASLEADAMAFEARARGEKQARDLGAVVDLHANTVRTDDLQFAAALAETTGAIAASGLPADERAKMQSAAQSSLAVAALSGMAERDPRAARSALAAGDFDRYLSPEQKNALVNNTDQEIRRLEAEAEARRREAQAVYRADVARRFDDAVVDVQVNGRSELVTRGELQAAYGGDDAARLWRALTDEADFYAVRQQVALTTPAEDEALIAQLRPEGENARAELERWQQLAKAIDAKRLALAEDPAAYVLAVSPALRSAHAAADRDPAKLPAALALADIAQRNLGVPRPLRRLLGGARADALVLDVLATPPAETADAMQALAERYGRHWPAVYAELVEAKLPDSFIVLATTDDPVARRLLAETMQAEAVKPGASKAALAADTVATIDETIEQELRPLRASLDYASDGVIVGARYDQAAKLLAYRMAATLPPEEAARHAALAVGTGKYEFTDTARAPAGRLDAIQASADRLLAGLKPEDLLDPGGAAELGIELRREKYLERLRAEGVWVTNEDDTGWVLFDPARMPALLKDGDRIEFSFADAPDLPPRRMIGGKGGAIMVLP